MDKKTFVVIDSHSVIHRAFHALPRLTTKKGELVNALYGFLLVFLKVIKELKPDFIAAVFDYPAPTFRHEKYGAYKANRPKAPEELYSQIPKVKEFLKNFDVAIFEKQGFEADDIVGTIASLASGIEVIILSGDTDLLQLVGSRAKVYFLQKGVKDTLLYDEKMVGEKYQGLRPDQLPDYKALKGDASDNIPGVPGIGDKTAIQLIRTAGSLEDLYAGFAPAKFKEKLLRYKEQAFLSKELATIQRNVSIDFKLNECKWAGYDKAKASRLFQNYEFYSLINKLP